MNVITRRTIQLLARNVNRKDHLANNDERRTPPVQYFHTMTFYAL